MAVAGRECSGIHRTWPIHLHCLCSISTDIGIMPIFGMVLILGDLNAKVGSDNKGRENIMGREGIGEINTNGERLYDFCQDNNLIIGGTVFQHKLIHKKSWKSPGKIPISALIFSQIHSRGSHCQLSSDSQVHSCLQNIPVRPHQV
jgi:hypothetical protein